MAQSQEVPHDLTSVQWRSVEWITAFGNLHPGNVLDYFAQSPFYDPTSNNAVLRMQTQFSVQAGQGFDEQQELKRFVGTEFAVTYCEPPDLFVIEKRDRKGPYEAHPIATYYVLHNSIYQSPDLYSVLSNRLLSSLYYMRTTLASAREKKTDFHPRTGGNRYRIVREEQAQNAAEEKAVAAGEDGNDGQVIAAGLNATTTKSERKASNLEFLLARALQTTSVQTASKPP